MDYDLARGEGELDGHEKEAMGGGGALCAVCRPSCLGCLERKVQLGDRARESGAKSGGRVKSAATLGYLIYNTLPSHLAYCTACNWPKPSKAVPGDHILLYLLKYT